MVKKKALLCLFLCKMSKNSSSAQHITRRDSVVEKDPDSTLNAVENDCRLHLSDEEVQSEQNKKGRGKPAAKTANICLIQFNVFHVV